VKLQRGVIGAPQLGHLASVLEDVPQTAQP